MPFVINYQETTQTDDLPRPVQTKHRSVKKKAVLRKLTATDKANGPAIRQHSVRHDLLRKAVVVIVIVALCVTGLLMLVANSKKLQLELAEHYHNIFDRLSRESDNLCAGADVNYTALSQALAAHVVGQTRARQDINDWITSEQGAPYRCMVFYGSPGVGKSLTAKVISTNFPWPEKVYFVTEIEHGSDRKRYAAFKSTLFKIQRTSFIPGKCTHYLIIVDRLSLDDIGIVIRMSDRLRSLSKKSHIFIRALFVYQGSNRELSFETIQKSVPEATFIRFNSLDERDLEQCIRREAESVGIDVENSESLVRMVASNINVSRHGCKPVRAKLNLYS